MTEGGFLFGRYFRDRTLDLVASSRQTGQGDEHEQSKNQVQGQEHEFTPSWFGPEASASGLSSKAA